GASGGSVDFCIAASRLWRRTDNPCAHKRAASCVHDVGNFQHGRRADRVAFNVDGLPVGGGEYRCKPLRERQGLAGRNYRHQEVGLRERAVLGRLHAGFARPFRTILAPPGERSEYRDFIFGQAPANAGAHIAGRNDGDDWGHEPVTPPSRLMLCPVTKEDASEARNSTAPTRFSGVSPRGTHCMPMMRSFCSGVTVLRSISVKVAPGKILLTVMPSAPTSRAIDRLIPASAALLAM